ncbi:MAG TPA: hypothetical protein PKE42_13750, partial [Arachnia sp.]|nr:hypothetical protein [Arachnia sp.]
FTSSAALDPEGELDNADRIAALDGVVLPESMVILEEIDEDEDGDILPEESEDEDGDELPEDSIDQDGEEQDDSNDAEQADDDVEEQVDSDDAEQGDGSGGAGTAAEALFELDAPDEETDR